jgi:hypothetical protein
MHVKQISGIANSPDGKPWAFDLTAKVLLVGHNGSHKSTIPLAIQLALTGTVDDFNGKDGVKDSGELIAMAPEDELWVEAILDDDSVCRWGTRREGLVVKNPIHDVADTVDVDSVFPLRAVRAVLNGSRDTARKEFLKWSGSTTSAIDVLAEIPAHLHARYRDVSEAKAKADPNLSPVDLLVLVAEYAKKREKEIEAEADAQDALVTQLGGTAGEKPSDDAVAQAVANTTAWERAWQGAVTWEAWQAAGVDTAPLHAQRDALLVQAATARQNVVAWETFITTSSPVTLVLEPVQLEGLRAAATLLHAAGERETCPVCSSSVGAAHLQNCLVYYREQVQTVEAGTAQARLDAAEGERLRVAAIADAQRSLDSWRAEEQRLLIEISRLDGQIGTIAARGEAPWNPQVDSTTALASLTAARAESTRLEKLKGNWDLLKQARDSAALLRSSKPEQADLAVNCVKAVGAILEKGVSTFEEHVQKYLPEGLQFGLQVKNGDRDVFQVGFRRDGKLHTYRSSAEGLTLQVAITLAVAELGGGAVKGKGKKKVPSSLRIVIPPDRRVDEEMLGRVMRAWAAFPGQVILESTFKPKGKAPAGWQIIDLDDWLAKRTVVPEPAAPQAPAAPKAPSTPQPIAPVVPFTPPPPAASVPVEPVSIAQAVASLPATLPPGLLFAPPVPGAPVAMAAPALPPPPLALPPSAPPVGDPLESLGFPAGHVMGAGGRAYVLEHRVTWQNTATLPDGTVRIFSGGVPLYDIRP